MYTHIHTEVLLVWCCVCVVREQGYLGLPYGFLDFIIGNLVSNGVPNPNAVTLQQEVVVHNGLNGPVEISRHLHTLLQKHQVHQGASLVTQSVLGENTTQQISILHYHLRVCGCGEPLHNITVQTHNII